MLKDSFKENVQLLHDDFFENLIKKEFSRVTDSGQVYLDYTGGNIYPEHLLEQHFELLKNNIFGNPHSTNPSSQFATQKVNEARNKVLDYFKAKDYYCIFTSNASGALKIVGEGYPFQDDGVYVLLSDNHNSVNGIREYCKERGGTFQYAPIHYENLMMDEAAMEKLLDEYAVKKNKLLAFPAQSNVSGVKHDLKWVEIAQNKGWDVLLDAAAFVPTNRLDLNKIKPDYVSISFYKIFGYPTGIGCLLIRKDKFEKLQKHWFAGGTVTLVSVNSQYHFLAKNHERFENGTVNYLDIPAIKLGLEFIENIGIEKITERVQSLTSYLAEQLATIKHENGSSVVKIFGPGDRSQSGGTLIMNFFDAEGNVFPFEEIEAKANKRLISIRSGCFCNPGIDEVNNCITTEELTAYFTSHQEGDYHSMIQYLNKMRGATRVSVGLATRKQDLDAFISFVESLR